MMQFSFQAVYNGHPVGLDPIDVIRAPSGVEAENTLFRYYEKTYNLLPPKTDQDADRGLGLELFLVSISPAKPYPFRSRSSSLDTIKCEICGIREATRVFYFHSESDRGLSDQPVFLCDRTRIYIPGITHSSEEEFYDPKIGMECQYHLLNRLEFQRGPKSLTSEVQYTIDKWFEMQLSRGSKTERRLHIKRRNKHHTI